MIPFVNPHSLNEYLEEEEQPVLLACIEKDRDFLKHRNILEDISQMYAGKLRVCLLSGEYMNLMNKKFEIYGTPAFVVCHRGKRKSMLLGKTDMDEMKSFVQSSRI